MRRSVVAILGVLAVPAAPVLAVQPSDFSLGAARQLAALCSAAPAEPLYLEALQFCYGYMAGMAHLHRALADGGDLKPAACPNHPVTRAELAEVFLGWTRANPDALDNRPAEAVMRAASATWPCGE